jgi:hypothetical protein
MSREIIIASWCDRCQAADESARVPATHTYTLGLVSGETRPELRVLMFCDSCDPVLAEVEDLLRKNSIPLDTGRTPATKGPADVPGPARIECRVCGETMARSSILQHVWSQHRPGEKRTAQPARCPDCREVFAPAGMSMHRARAHGWSALDDAYDGLI